MDPRKRVGRELEIGRAAWAISGTGSSGSLPRRRASRDRRGPPRPARARRRARRARCCRGRWRRAGGRDLRGPGGRGTAFAESGPIDSRAIATDARISGLESDSASASAGTASLALGPRPNSVEAAVARNCGSSLFSISMSPGTAGSPARMIARLALPRASGSVLLSWEMRAPTSGPCGPRPQAAPNTTPTSASRTFLLTPATVRLAGRAVSVAAHETGRWAPAHRPGTTELRDVLERARTERTDVATGRLGHRNRARG